MTIVIPMPKAINMTDVIVICTRQCQSSYQCQSQEAHTKTDIIVICYLSFMHDNKSLFPKHKTQQMMNKSSFPKNKTQQMTSKEKQQSNKGTKQQNIIDKIHSTLKTVP